MSLFPSNANFDTIRNDVRTLTDDTVKAARSHVVDPTLEAAHRASEMAKKAIHDSREKMNEQMAIAERYASQGYDRTTTWISANPLAAVGVAMAAGLLISSMFRTSRR